MDFNRFSLFCIDAHGFAMIFIDFGHGSPKTWQDSKLCSETLIKSFVGFQTFFVFHIFSWLAGWLAVRLPSELSGSLGLLGLPGSLEGVFGFLALSEGGLNHKVSHSRRSERSADSSISRFVLAS